MLDWSAIWTKAWHGAVIAALIGVFVAICMSVALFSLQQPVAVELTLFFIEGVLIGFFTGGVLEFFRQKGWWTQ